MDIENIKSLLSERHMTFEDLATKMGKERSVVYKTITNGNPTLNFLVKLSEALDLSIDYIVNVPQTESVQKQEQRERKASQIDGFVEIDGCTYRIRTREDMNELVRLLDNQE